MDNTESFLVVIEEPGSEGDDDDRVFIKPNSLLIVLVVPLMLVMLSGKEKENAYPANKSKLCRRYLVYSLVIFDDLTILE